MNIQKIAKLLLARRVLRGATSPFFARPQLLRMISRVTRNHAGANASRIHVRCGQARYNIVAQQSVHPTWGTRRVFQAFFWLWVFPVSTATLPSHPKRVTQAVGLFFAK
jgi:hypothetical protein